MDYVHVGALFTSFENLNRSCLDDHLTISLSFYIRVLLNVSRLHSLFLLVLDWNHVDSDVIVGELGVE